MASKQIPLNKILTAIDRKDRNFYDNLSDDEKKGFSPFLMLRYASSVQSDPDMEHYYIASTNHYANKNMLEKPLSAHPKMQWLLFTAISPGIGVLRHNWIKQKKKGTVSKSSKDITTMLMDLYPTMKLDDIEVLSNFVTKKELNEYAKDCGKTKNL